MKKILTILIALSSLMGYSQSEMHFLNNALKISPIQFKDAEFQLSYERYFGERNSSITISPSVILKENSMESKEGFRLESQYRIFLSHKRSDQGRIFLGFHNLAFYTGVYGQFFKYQEDFQFYWFDEARGESFMDVFTKNITAWEGGALIGLQVDITKKILADLFLGGGVRYPSIMDSRKEVIDPRLIYDESGVFKPEYKGVKPRIGFQLGFLF